MGPPLPAVPFGGKGSERFPGGGAKRPGGGRIRERPGWWKPGWGGISPGRRNSWPYSSSSAPSGPFEAAAASAR